MRFLPSRCVRDFHPGPRRPRDFHPRPRPQRYRFRWALQRRFFRHFTHVPCVNGFKPRPLGFSAFYTWPMCKRVSPPTGFMGPWALTLRFSAFYICSMCKWIKPRPLFFLAFYTWPMCKRIQPPTRFDPLNRNALARRLKDFRCFLDRF